MKSLRNGKEILKKWLHSRYHRLEAASVHVPSTSQSTVDRTFKKIVASESSNSSGTDIVKPYTDLGTSKIPSNNYKSRVVHHTRAVARWLNDRESCEDWNKMWTSPQTFHANKVPLDIRMGPAQNMVPKPHKYGNLELVKVQNFLHLTPPSVKNHCKHLKKFCTPWPKELKTSEECETEFPLCILTSDYINASQTQRNSKARIVTAQKTEPWESREYASDEDGLYWWEDSNSSQAASRILKHHPSFSSGDETRSSDDLLKIEEVKNYRDAVCKMKLTYKDASRDDRAKAMLQYKDSVRNLLGLPQL